MIEFKTYDEQIEILQSRGLIIDDIPSAKLFLEKNNYYNVVNAYKDIFLEKGITPDKFKPNTRFDDIISIWTFDKTLRIELFKRITEIERIIKSQIAYEFSRLHGIQDYLCIDNFNEIKYTLQINALLRRIDDEVLRLKRKNDKMLLHYSSHYGCIPLWVLINVFSMGDVGKMFEYMKDSDQKTIAKKLSQIFSKRLEPTLIINYIKILVQVRNLCAHDQRVFTFTSPYTAPNDNPINSFLGISKPINSFFAIVPAIYSFSTPEAFKSFVCDLNNCFYHLRFFSIKTMELIYEIMGLPTNWQHLIHIA